MKIFVVGSLNMDLVIKAPYMPENGVTMHGEGFMTNPGGKGANQVGLYGDGTDQNGLKQLRHG